MKNPNWTDSMETRATEIADKYASRLTIKPEDLLNAIKEFAFPLVNKLAKANLLIEHFLRLDAQRDQALKSLAWFNTELAEPSSSNVRKEPK